MWKQDEGDEFVEGEGGSLIEHSTGLDTASVSQELAKIRGEIQVCMAGGERESVCVFLNSSLCTACFGFASGGSPPYCWCR